MSDVSRRTIDERFDDTELDESIWVPYYLAHWSSRQESAATYELSDAGLRLSIPQGQGLWCPDLHDEPLRVSCIQSASFSGPLGTTRGPQPFREGLFVAEEQPTLWGYTPTYARIAVTMRGNVTGRSMFAFWMSGIEDEPERSGEICVAEIFGSDITDEGALIGSGVRAFRDPMLEVDFSTTFVPIDVTQDHTYGIEWSPRGLVFSIDSDVVRTSAQSPDYPMQLMIGVFDFPDRDGPEDHVPEVNLSHILGRPIDARA